MNPSLTIEQLLLAARLLEEKNGMNPLFSSLNDANLYKLGQDYKEHYLQPKMSTVSDASPCMNSTGTSQRSTPSAMSLHSSNSANSTAPSSPAVVGAARGCNSTRQSRAAHNELEKNRRANLRNFLEKLKSVLPPDVESTRDTTLSLLTRARNFIRVVKQRETQFQQSSDGILDEHARLQARLDALNAETAQAVDEQAEEEELLVVDESMEQLAQPALVEMPSLAAPEPAIIKPEPRPPQSPIYIEYSPSAKPVDSFQAQLSVLQQLAQLNQQLQLVQQQQLLYQPAIRTTPIDLINEGLLPSGPLAYPYNYLEQARTGNLC